MEKIQNFLNDASEFIFGDQTQDHAIVIDEQMKIDLANYIDDMGYDLVGYGFLGEVERDENNNIEEIKSADDSVDYLYAYILANERTYALQGSDDNLQNNVTNILTVLGGFAISPGIGVGILFTKVADGLSNSIYLENHKELTGMISIPLIEFQDSADDFFDTVIIDRDKNELKVSRWNPSLDEGFTNIDTWSWDLNGWSGRYGKPLELSLALHLSTMAPDFVYNFCMDEDLQTIVNVALKNIEYNATYKYVTANNETVTEGQVNEVYIDMKDYIDEMKYLESTEKRELPTPLNDNYATPKGIFEDINVVEVNNKRYRFTNKEGNTIQCFSEKGETLMENYYMSFDENGEPFFENATDDNSSRLEANEDNPCFYYDDNNIEIEIKILCLNEIINILSSESADEYLKEVALENLSEMANFSDKTVDNWIDNKIKNPSQTYKRGDEKYSNQFNNVKDSNDNYKEKAERLREIQSKLIEDFSLVLSDYEKQQEENNKLLEKWGIDTTTLEILYNVFNNVSSELKTYQPYITSVTNHWYKDIYFAGTPESGQTLKNISPGDIVYKLVDSKSDSQAYNPEGLANSEEIEILNENGQFYVDLTPKSGFTEVEQVGQPGYTDEEEWHWKVKNWIQYGYYFIYDGTEKTADEIKRARKYLKNEAENKYDSTDPLLGVDGKSESIDPKEIELKADKINTELKEKGFNVKLQRINFAKKSSLAAFSILESVHTFDAEYVYRNLKEFLIELGYFTRADFESIETNVLDWIIPEYIPIEWPNLKYEKKDTDYGTYIMSKKGYDEERGTDENSSSNSNNTSNNETDNNVKSTTDYLFIGDSITVGYAGVTQNSNGRFNSSNNYISGKYTNSSLGDCYFEAEVGATISNWNTNYETLIKSVYQNKGIKGIVVMLGANGLDENGMRDLLQKLKSDFQNVPIYVQATLHFSEQWNKWKTGNDAIEQNKKIDSFNNSIERYCSNNNINFIYTTSGLYADDGQLAYTDDGVHLNQSGRGIIIANIKSSITNNIGTSGNNSGSEGFEEGLDVITPGEGKVKSIDKDSITIELLSPDTVKGMTINIEGFDVDTATISENDTLEKKAIIGKTTNSNIKIIMRDEKKAIINNVEDYIDIPTNTTQGTSGTSMGEMEDAIEFIWRWEGVSDADPNDGDYYTVCYPSNDIPTVGHGVTGWTWEIWHELGYSEYISAGNGSSPATFLKTKIPKSIVDEVSKTVIEKDFANLDNTLASKGITGWGIDQKAAYISLQYNGFAQKRAEILNAFASGNGAEAKRIWLDCYNRDQSEYGHKRRRATELEIFYEGHYCTTDAEFNAAYNKYYN